MRQSSTADLNVLFRQKVDLVIGAAGTRSLREFGGLWMVHGRYLLEPALALNAEFASMIDLMDPCPEFDGKVEALARENPGLSIELVHEDFRKRELYGRLRPVDTSILFDVLLHQDNYVSILDQVAGITEKYICVAQPCLKEEEFGLPASATLLQFWPEELKDRYREGSLWPKDPRVDRFHIGYWMWGHTASHLVSCLHGLGWGLQYGEEVSDIWGPKWNYALMRFTRR